MLVSATPCKKLTAVRGCGRETVQLIYPAMLASLKREMREKKALLLREMAAMPDYQLSLQWELGSPIFGFLLRKFAPHDTYKVCYCANACLLLFNPSGFGCSSAQLFPT